ncbi:histone deacetylase [Solirubrobacter sp. CPCC 204708]|uniref:Histone deacetylase n=1 Tax=Solirubrobacter deserti TaxID=2282478 RepID=A0ABT4RKA9_9ACTN|nr:histone deacetylase [Solirubrobacter deserti]MBE2316848.1 histone deacetylase [Solirubrobacter deserti]MDA0138935.1 histone deacetylase [Solirubrobacter deserti]
MAMTRSLNIAFEVWSHDRWSIPLPDGHKFPISKYTLLRERVQDRVIVRESDAVSWETLALVHEQDLLDRIRTGQMSIREQRGLGLPWSETLVERGRRSVGGTMAAARRALEHGVGMNLGGGTHHAGRDFARGYCLFNDVAVTLARLREEGAVRSAVVVDCDVHQGDGTAQILGQDPDAFTLSLHGARNYPFQRIPSDLDVDLPSGTGDDDYLAELDRALDVALSGAYDIAFYLAGADPWEGDRLGRLSLTKPGLRARDELVLTRLRGIPTVVVLAGGYAPDPNDTVDINAATLDCVLALR